MVLVPVITRGMWAWRHMIISIGKHINQLVGYFSKAFMSRRCDAEGGKFVSFPDPLDVVHHKMVASH